MYLFAIILFSDFTLAKPSPLLSDATEMLYTTRESD